MSTVAQICRRALLRARVIAAGEEPSAEDASDALALLNEMMFNWAAMGVDVGHATMAGADAFVFMVPPLAAEADTLAALASQGAWNASTNSPALATSTGTDGYWYRVTTAGATTLDDVASWAVDDYAVFVKDTWLKGRSSAMFDSGVIAMLGLQICSDHGKEPPPVLARDASRGWRQIQACFVKPKFNDTIDIGLVNMASRRFVPDGTILG